VCPQQRENALAKIKSLHIKLEQKRNPPKKEEIGPSRERKIRSQSEKRRISRGGHPDKSRYVRQATKNQPRQEKLSL